MKSRALGLALTPALAVSAMADTDAKVSSQHRVRYYAVSGLTLEALTDSLNDNGPTGPNGVRAFGLTEWQVDWQYRAWDKPEDCELLYVRVGLETIVTLPKWADEADAPPELVRFWKEFSAVVEQHEDGHVAIAKAAADEVAEAIASVEPRPTCGAAAREADHAARDVVARHRDRDLAYDRDTGTGVDQIRALLRESQRIDSFGP